MQMVRCILRGQHYSKRHRHAKNLNTASVRIFAQMPLVPASHMHYHARRCVSAGAIVNESPHGRSTWMSSPDFSSLIDALRLYGTVKVMYEDVPGNTILYYGLDKWTC